MKSFLQQTVKKYQILKFPMEFFSSFDTHENPPNEHELSDIIITQDILVKTIVSINFIMKSS